jgi:DNA-binding NarL/FixJ family response regulator
LLDLDPGVCNAAAVAVFSLPSSCIVICHPLEVEDAVSKEIPSHETEVLRMLAEGLVNKEIAALLGISEHTVKFRVSSILDKLGASTRTEAVTLGIRRGLIPI